MSKLLLYIDDDDEDLEIFQEALIEVNPRVKVIKALDGLQGFSYLQSSKPDYIFLDINMPNMSGIEVLKLIRSQPTLNSVPVVMVSTTIRDEGDLIKKGATACMKKPSSFTELCNSLRAYFESNTVDAQRRLDSIS